MTDFKRYSIEEMRAQFNVMPGSDRFDETLHAIESDAYVAALMSWSFRYSQETIYRRGVALRLSKLVRSSR
jgi:hypothetical protein